MDCTVRDILHLNRNHFVKKTKCNENKRFLSFNVRPQKIFGHDALKFLLCFLNIYTAWKLRLLQ